MTWNVMTSSHIFLAYKERVHRNAINMCTFLYMRVNSTTKQQLTPRVCMCKPEIAYDMTICRMKKVLEAKEDDAYCYTTIYL